VILTREEVLAVDDLPQETLEVPGWGGEIVVRGLTRGEAYEARDAAKRDDDTADLLAYDMQVFLKGVVEPKFTKADIAKLKGKSAGMMELVTTRIMALSSVNEFGDITQKAVDEAEASFRDGE